MCIIVAKPKGVAMPNETTLYNCFINNPDGAGFMIATGKTVKIRKGFMTFDAFIDALESEGDLTDRAAVIHFRIATHGKVTGSNCHPFPVSHDMRKLRKLECSDTLAVAHNGVIPNMTTNKKTSDTMAYVSSILAPLRKLNSSLIYSTPALEIIENTLHSKMALLDATGELVTIGEFIENGGVLYSNSTFNSYRYNFSSYAELWNDEDSVYYDKDIQRPLPYDICEECDFCHDCASFAPYCQTEQAAYNEVIGQYDATYEDDAVTDATR